MSSPDLKAVYFVRYRGPNAWIVQREGNVRPTSIHPNQRRAEAAAVKLARKNAPAKVVVYNQDGTLDHEDNVERAKPTKASGQ
jgi:hypothetical protein